MRILAVHAYYRQIGGEDLSFEAECELLERRGHEVTRFTVRNDELTGAGAWKAASTTVWNGSVKRRLQETIREVRPAVMHCTNTFPLISPSAYWEATRQGVAVVQSLRNYRLLCPAATLFREGKVCTECVGRSFASPAVRHGCYRGSRAASATVASANWLNRLAGSFRQVDLFYTLTEFSRQQFLAAGLASGIDPQRLRVKPNFLDPAPAIGDGGRGGAIYVGRLSGEKGLATLLEAWRHLREPIPLRIVGDGPLRDLVTEAARRDARIQYLGFLSPAQAVQEIGRSDCLVMPSVWYETFGRTMMEAFARGTPVVASRLGAMTELVEDGVTGLHFPPGDSAALATAVRTLLSDRPRLQQMRIASRQTFERRFTGDTNYAALMGLYEEALEHAARRRETAGPVGRAPVPLPVLPTPPLPPSTAAVSDRTPVPRRPVPRAWRPNRRPARKTRRSTVLAMVDQGVVSLTNFLTVVLVAKYAGLTELGQYSLAFTALVILMTVQDCFVATPYTVFLSECRGRVARHLTGNYLGLGAVLGGTLTALCLAVAAVGAGVGASSVLLGLTLAMAVALPGILARELVRRIALANFDVRRALEVDVLAGLLQMGLLLILAATGRLTSASAVMALGGSAAVGAGLWLLLQRGRWAVQRKAARAHWQRALHYGKWLWAARLTSNLHSYVVPWLLGVLVGLEAVGGFSACFALIAAANPLLMGFTNLLAPQAARSFARGGAGAVRQVVGRATAGLTVISLTFAAGIAVAAELLLRTLYGEDFVEFAPVAGLLAVALVASAVGTPAEHGLRAVQRPQACLWASGLGLAVTFFSALALVPAMGVRGGAWALVAGSILCSVARGISFARHTRDSSPAGAITPPSPDPSASAAPPASRRLPVEPVPCPG